MESATAPSHLTLGDQVVRSKSSLDLETLKAYVLFSFLVPLDTRRCEVICTGINRDGLRRDPEN